ncbi:MAG: glycosyltransferase, partial [Clostridium sp.]
LQAADFIISRAGANVIFELLALKKPTLLIPLSKKISRGDQILNAESFEKEGFSIVLDEDVMIQSDVFMNKLKELKENKDRLLNNMQKSHLKNGVDEIVKVIMKSIELNK